MVTYVIFRVNFAFQRCEMTGAHEMIYPEVESPTVERQPRAAANSHETVGKSIGDSMSGIGDRGIVEVATYDDGIVAMLFNPLMYGIGLTRPDGHGLAQLVDKK